MHFTDAHTDFEQCCSHSCSNEMCIFPHRTTPRFRCTQNDEYVILDIHTPYVRVQDMEMEIDDKDFHFYCKPYHLRLHFSHSLVDDERARAEYDIDRDHGTISCYLPKLETGQVFEDLDLVNKLLGVILIHL